MTYLSIFLPLTSPVELFEDTMASLLRHQPEDSEIIAIHNGEYEDPHDLEYEGVKFLTRSENESTIDTILRGAAECDGSICHLLSCGTEVEEGWCDQPLELFQDPHTSSVSPWMVFEDEPDVIATLGIGHTRSFRPTLPGYDCDRNAVDDQRSRICGPSRWGAFYRTDLLELVGSSGWSPNDDLFDLQLALLFSGMGWLNRCAEDCIIRVEESIHLMGQVNAVTGSSLERTRCQFDRRWKGGWWGGLKTSLSGYAE